jgi:exosortase F-associated protein
MKERVKLKPELLGKIALLAVAMTILIVVYVLQRLNFSSFLLRNDLHPNTVFILNRTFRLVANDFACFILIYVFFEERKYLKMGFWVFLVELLLILPLYLIVKLSLEGASEISSPLLSQVHRLIVNPTLMILLMLGFVYQRHRAADSDRKGRPSDKA